MSPRHVSPVQWEQSVGYARTVCARMFRDGGTPAAALAAFGLEAGNGVDWSNAVDRIAQHLCAPRHKMAA